MAWFRKPKTRLQAADRRDLPGDVWEKCPACGEILYREKLKENWNVCPSCAHHLRLPAEHRLLGEAVGEDDGVHRSGAGGADAFEGDAFIFQQPVEHAPGEGAVRAAALERQVNGMGRFLSDPTRGSFSGLRTLQRGGGHLSSPSHVNGRSSRHPPARLRR